MMVPGLKSMLDIMKSSTLFWLDTVDSVDRPDAEEAFVIQTPNVTIPWPEGMTVEEALNDWRAKAVKEHFDCVHDRREGYPAYVSHWSDCDLCYDYHEDGHMKIEVVAEPESNKDHRYRG